MTTGELFSRLAGLGGYFAVVPVEPIASSASGWRPLAELVGSPQRLVDRAERGRALLAGRAGLPAEAVDARAAASVVHLGLAARLASPALAVAMIGGGVPDVRRDGWCWREPAPGEPTIGLGASVVGGGTGPPGEQAELTELAEAFAARVLRPVLLPLEDAVHAGCRVSRRVLRGNLASALAGAVVALTAAEPRLGTPARDVVGAVLAGPHLAGHGEYAASGFRRRSCCLYYRLPGGGLCGDCVLHHRR